MCGIEARRNHTQSAVCLASGFCVMAYRSKPYRIRIPGLRSPHRVPATFWRRFVALGWLVAVTPSSRTAQPRAGVAAWLEDGRIRLQDREAGVGASIPCSWAWVERAALYSQRGPNMGTLEYERAIQRHHCER